MKNRDLKGRFVKGHNLSNGYIVSKKTKQKISDSLAGHTRTEESIKNQQNTWKIKMANGYISPHRGDIGYWKDKHLSNGMKQCIGNTLRGKYSSGEITNPFKGKHQTKEAKKKISKANEGRIPWNKHLTKETDERVMKVAKALEGKPSGFLGKHHTTETVNQIFVTKIKNGTLHNQYRPTSLEKQFLSICQKYHLPYKYVGNGDFIIGRLNPDFINTNGEKIAVEVYAKYFKKKTFGDINKWKKERSSRMAEYGWRVVYFDENEVVDNIVLSKLGSGKFV